MVKESGKDIVKQIITQAIDEYGNAKKSYFKSSRELISGISEGRILDSGWVLNTLSFDILEETPEED